MAQLALLEQAAQEPIGLLVRVVGDVEKLRQKLYGVRRLAGPQAGLEGLQFRLSPWPEGQLVICRQGARAGQGHLVAGPERPFAQPLDLEDELGLD